MTMQATLFAEHIEAAKPVTVRLPLGQLVSDAIRAIENAMISTKVTCAGVSYGKDSSVVLALTLQAARNLLNRGIRRRVVVLTSNTLVENPSVIKLAYRMSRAMLEWSKNAGIEVEQRWVTPAPADHYLVSMIGGRAVASAAGGKSTCTIDLKIRPMDKVRKELAKEYGAENILTLIGTRFDESNTRGNRMRARGESSTRPQQTDSGSWLLSPIADWIEGDVWAFLNADQKRLGFATLDFTPTLALYETIGESTCSIGAIDPEFGKSASSCGGGRTGCWACQKVTRDHSLEGMTERFPAYEPLTRLSRIIRAGHYVPENRSYLSKSITPEGTIKVFSNGYSARWTEKLLAWTMTVDANEDDYARKTGKPRRFPRLLEPEHLVLIAFHWARYGQHAPGAFIRIYERIESGYRYQLPSDEDIQAIESRSDKGMIGKELGEIHLTQRPETREYRDDWRTTLGTLASFDSDRASCTVAAMDEDTYTSGKGQRHDALVSGEQLEADLSDLLDAQREPTAALYDFMWWWSMEFAEGNRSNVDEMNWLLREGIVRARNGYQAQIVRYQDYCRALQMAGLEGKGGSLNELMLHPGFVPATSKNTQSQQFDLGA